MVDLIPDINSHGATNIIGLAIILLFGLDKMGMLRLPKRWGGKEKKNHKGNPGTIKCPLEEAEHFIPEADRKLIHDLITSNTAMAEVFCRKDNNGAYELIVCLRNIEANTLKFARGVGE